MKELTGNTLLITGGGSGIGRGLAEAFHRLGNRVVITGRRREKLDETVEHNPGMESMTLDVADPAAIGRFAAEAAERFPTLNVLVNNAGITRVEDLAAGGAGEAEAIVATNLLGPIRLTVGLLPLLRRQPSATVMNVGSGLGFVPIFNYPTYCATKAAIHSWSQSLRYQLKDDGVDVIELIPPYVQTRLGGGYQAEDPDAMPLDDYIAETMDLLRADPSAHEVAVERVGLLRNAERENRYDRTFAEYNRAIEERAAAVAGGGA